MNIQVSLSLYSRIASAGAYFSISEDLGEAITVLPYLAIDFGLPSQRSKHHVGYAHSTQEGLVNKP